MSFGNDEIYTTECQTNTCPQGKVASANNLECEFCPAGTDEKEVGICSPCAPNTFNDGGKTLCIPCENCQP